MYALAYPTSAPGHVPVVGHGQQERPDPFERSGADAADLPQLLVVGKWPVGRACFNNALRERWTDARELGEFRPFG